ncbi:MAG: NAD(P)/FAD-dependent oxidoreductase [Clostridia bacterium]|nr:NAD(P)/FAD-dependent oxidoreductase [Clostridia bacterium]
MPDVVVIGGGAAGMMAGISASRCGQKVLIIEQNKMLGRKMRITGKGRCNVTNIASTDEMMQFIPKNNRFLFSAFKNFDNNDLIQMLEDEGVKLKTERGGRVFPQSDKAVDIVNGLRSILAKCKVTVLIGDKVTEVLTENGQVTGVKTDKGRTVLTKKVIICTGGKSYPLTGSDGSGYALAKSLGHNITPIKPALIPLETAENWVTELQGLSLKNVAVTLEKASGKKVYEDFGEMIFTHFGISGPVVLSASCHINDNEKYIFSIDLKPALDEKQLEDRVLRDFKENMNKNFENALSGLFPQKLIPVIVKLSGIDNYKKVNVITKEERKKLCYITKNLRLTIIGTIPIEEAIVTDGGVQVKEINPSTMESKIVKGLFFAGEVIDIVAYTGGYNLQIAFSTGYLAGKSGKE